MRTSAVLVQGLWTLWFLVVSSCLLGAVNTAVASLSQAKERADGVVARSWDTPGNCHVAPLWLEMRTRATSAVFWYFGVILVSAAVLSVITSLGDVWSKRDELRIAFASVEVTIACRGGDGDAVDAKEEKATTSRKSHHRITSGLAFLSLLSAALLLGFVSAAKNGKYYRDWGDCFLRSHRPFRVPLRKELRRFFVFGIVAVVVSALAFLVFFASLVRSHFKLLQKLCRGLVDRTSDDDDDNDVEREHLVEEPDAGTKRPEEGRHHTAEDNKRHISKTTKVWRLLV